MNAARHPRTAILMLDQARLKSLSAWVRRRGHRSVWAEFFEEHYLLVTPAMQLTAFPLGL